MLDWFGTSCHVSEIRFMQGVGVFYNIKGPPSKCYASVSIFIEFMLQNVILQLNAIEKGIFLLNISLIFEDNF